MNGNMQKEMHETERGVRWLSGRTSDSESRGPGFSPHKRHYVVFLNTTH